MTQPLMLCRRPRRVIAVEPVSANLAALRANLAWHGFSETVTVVAAALGASPVAAADITVYPRMPGNSTFHPAEKLAVQSPFMQRPDMFAGARTECCAVRTLSGIIDAEQLESIDLLKVDVEGTELRALQGLEDRHWPLLKQVAMEVLDVTDRPATISALLEGKGFHVTVVPGQPACNVMLYAVRNLA